MFEEREAIGLLVLFGILGAIILLLIVVLLRRGGNRTENADGLLIEQEARVQAAQDRVSYNSFAVHNSPLTQSDSYQRRR
ncbi:hypothetical protein GCM10010305_60950 [Streptomyces termitum]|uniref:Uncharacterized protein n=1 Tax=Streptomyces termitum TaxID=67368 RepID=A0A918T9V6_9ACTN|nr:hypothetical protein GCM10010305_60950 [Streptomyces termitum]